MTNWAKALLSKRMADRGLPALPWDRSEAGTYVEYQAWRYWGVQSLSPYIDRHHWMDVLDTLYNTWEA